MRFRIIPVMNELLEGLQMLLERGGPVMIPLLVLSVCSLALIIERIIFWTSLNSRVGIGRITAINTALRKGDLARARGLVEGDRSPYGHLANRLMEDGATDAVALAAVDEARPALDRYMIALSTVITAAPLLGILGTVIGIIQSFQLLGSQSTLTDPTEVAGGIAAALITTAFGLIVALITLFPYMLFKGQSIRAIGRMETLIASAQHGTSVAHGGESEES
jgi:biopolymer transport protein ExbB